MAFGPRHPTRRGTRKWAMVADHGCAPGRHRRRARLPAGPRARGGRTCPAHFFARFRPQATDRSVLAHWTLGPSRTRARTWGRSACRCWSERPRFRSRGLARSCGRAQSRAAHDRRGSAVRRRRDYGDSRFDRDVDRTRSLPNTSRPGTRRSTRLVGHGPGTRTCSSIRRATRCRPRRKSSSASADSGAARVYPRYSSPRRADLIDDHVPLQQQVSGRSTPSTLIFPIIHHRRHDRQVSAEICRLLVMSPLLWYDNKNRASCVVRNNPYVVRRSFVRKNLHNRVFSDGRRSGSVRYAVAGQLRSLDPGRSLTKHPAYVSGLRQGLSEKARSIFDQLLELPSQLRQTWSRVMRWGPAPLWRHLRMPRFSGGSEWSCSRCRELEYLPHCYMQELETCWPSNVRC